MTTYLVRHGSAGDRGDHHGDDLHRPLDDAGRLQAERIADWLRHEPISRLVSSPYLRCVQTLEPLAAAAGLQVELADELAEGSDVDVAWSLLGSLASEQAVLSSHGDVIPDLIRRAQMRGLHVPGKAGCAKGSVWTLRHWDGERFATGVYTPIARA